MNINLKAKMAGRYKLQILKAGKFVKETDWFNNLITDYGLNYFGDVSTCFTENFDAHVGSGSTAPANSDVSLVTEVATSSNGTYEVSPNNSGAPDYYWSSVVKWTFSVGSIDGNISEVGISPTGTNLFSRALILDSGGSPTALTINSDEQLILFYEFRLYPPLVDNAGTITNLDDSTTYDYTSRANRVQSSFDWDMEYGMSRTPFIAVFDGAMNSITSDPSGTSASASASLSAYVEDSFERSCVISMSSAQGNLASGIKTIRLVHFGPGSFKAEFDPVIPKDDTKALSGWTFTLSWARASI